MQIVSTGNNLYEMSKPVFWEKEEIYFKMSSADDNQTVIIISNLKFTYKKPIGSEGVKGLRVIFFTISRGR